MEQKRPAGVEEDEGKIKQIKTTIMQVAPDNTSQVTPLPEEDSEPQTQPGDGKEDVEMMEAKTEVSREGAGNQKINHDLQKVHIGSDLEVENQMNSEDDPDTTIVISDDESGEDSSVELMAEEGEGAYHCWHCPGGTWSTNMWSTFTSHMIYTHLRYLSKQVSYNCDKVDIL